MHLDPIILRVAVIVAVLVVVYGSRMTKGSMTKTPEGLVFAIKPLIVWTRLPVLILVVVYVMTARIYTAPWWVYVVFFATIAFIVAQMPGTITLTPTAITQRFWFRPSKAIQYNEVMAIQSLRAGTTRVFGDNRATITHTLNHSAAAEFQQELERRTGKRVTA
jgi:small-conductance mechanosensitive channel